MGCALRSSAQGSKSLWFWYVVNLFNHEYFFNWLLYLIIGHINWKFWLERRVSYFQWEYFLTFVICQLEASVNIRFYFNLIFCFLLRSTFYLKYGCVSIIDVRGSQRLNDGTHMHTKIYKLSVNATLKIMLIFIF